MKHLAGGADMGAASGDANFDNFGTTNRAGLTFASKNLGEELEIIPSGAVGADVGGHGGAARVNRMFHDGASGLEQERGLFLAE